MWFKQRASVMRPTAYQSSKVWERFEEKLTVSMRQTNATKPSMLSGNLGITTICREYTSARDATGSRPVGTRVDNTVTDPALDVQVTLEDGKYCIEIEINSLQIENTVSWVVITRGLDRYVTPLSEGNTISTSTSTSSPTVPENSGTRQLVATHELSVLRHGALPTRQAEQSNVSVKMPPPHFAGRLSYVAVENNPQPSLKARE